MDCVVEKKSGKNLSPDFFSASLDYDFIFCNRTKASVA